MNVGERAQSGALGMSRAEQTPRPPVMWQPDLHGDSQRWSALAADLTARVFAPLATELDEKQRYPWESIEVLVENGLTGLFVPREYGGQGASLSTTCAVLEEIARGCASTCAILNAYVLGAFAILLEGSEAQKSRYLPGLAKDGVAISFALTERGSGSDASAIKTKAVRAGDRFRLVGEKVMIGNGGASRYYVVFAKNQSEESDRIGAFIVDREVEGVEIDHYEDKMGIRGTLTSNLRLDAIVDDSAVLGPPGRGLQLALRTLNIGRITVAAQAMGIGLSAFDHAVQRAAQREAFGQPIIDNQGIGFRLADTAVELSAARMVMYEAAKWFDEGKDFTNLSAMAKLLASEAAHKAVDTAVQVFGGYGYLKPNVVERLYRDQRITEIYEGTSEIQRLILVRAIKHWANRKEGLGT